MKNILAVVVVAVAMSACQKERPPERKVRDLQTWQKLAELGYPPAQFKMGELYDVGHQVDCDRVVAAIWYRKAAEQGFVPAQVELAESYYKGQGVPQDYVMAAAWLEIANQSDCNEVRDKLELLRKGLWGNRSLYSGLIGYGVSSFDKVLSNESRKVSVRRGCREEDFQPDTFLHMLEISNAIDARSFESKKKMAELGDPEAQFELGECYKYGIGVDENIAEAIVWYRRAAEMDSMVAQRKLAEIYQHPYRGFEDIPEAIKWYQRAAQQGERVAQYELAKCYLSGIGVSKDEVSAADWCWRAAEQGLSAAECMLAECYEDGVGLPRDEQKAFEWYRRAAEHGNSNAQTLLGMRMAISVSSSRDERIEGCAWLNLGIIAISENEKIRYPTGKEHLSNPGYLDEKFMLSDEFVSKVQERSRYLFEKVQQQSVVVREDDSVASVP